MTPEKKVLLEVKNLKVYFKVKTKNRLPWQAKKKLKAVDDVSFSIYEGETLGVVGESGCGKTSLARSLIGLNPISSGEVIWKGKNIAKFSSKEWFLLRSEIQYVFQDPFASLDPRYTVGEIIAEPLTVHEPGKSQAYYREQVLTIMQKVGLTEKMINRYPHEFSGGQAQRIGIARALILRPKLLICDEPVSALDVSIQAQVINLLQDLQKEFGLTIIFIAHNLSVVKHISNHVMVMYLGKIMEYADKYSLYHMPQHPYTQALLASIPEPDPVVEKSKKAVLLEGDLPSPINPPTGCVFRTRCPIASAECAEIIPALENTNVGAAHQVACIKV